MVLHKNWYGFFINILLLYFKKVMRFACVAIEFCWYFEIFNRYVRCFMFHYNLGIIIIMGYIYKKFIYLWCFIQLVGKTSWWHKSVISIARVNYIFVNIKIISLLLTCFHILSSKMIKYVCRYDLILCTMNNVIVYLTY